MDTGISNHIVMEKRAYSWMGRRGTVDLFRWMEDATFDEKEETRWRISL